LIEARRDVATTVIVVTDNGGGIPEGDRARIFEPFFTSKRAQGGTGLGLPIARALIEGHRGTLKLDRIDQGTRFLIHVPS
jgi:signal transduction histidine kinase